MYGEFIQWHKHIPELHELMFFKLVSKKTVFALTPFLLSTPAIAAPHQNLQEKAVEERAIPAIIEGFGLATTVIDSVMTLIEGSGDSSSEESAPRSLGQIQGHGAQAVCISGEKPANPVWFRTQMRDACKKVAEVEDAPTTGKYENMISTIWKATADWGQELEFELAWYAEPLL
jgi:hypothetical protein